MNSERGCFFVDGSHLFASTERVKQQHPELKSSKLNIAKLSGYLTDTFGENFNSSVRVIYYFRKNDTRIKDSLTIPPLHGERGHWQIKECGENLKGQKPIPTDILDQLPEEYRDMYPRAEKGVDMELACDALLLAAQGTVRSFVFVINDRDYIPLLAAIQRLGLNNYLSGLDVRQKIQEKLLNLSDRYLTLETHLNDIFDYSPPVEDDPTTKA
jgi:uncharacterized LabA/DUF88 family protein